MECLKDKKLVHKEEEGDKEVELKVDFDRTKHLRYFKTDLMSMLFIILGLTI